MKTDKPSDIEQILESAQKQEWPELFAIYMLATMGLMISDPARRRETRAALVKLIAENAYMTKVWPKSELPVVMGDIVGVSALHVAEQAMMQDLPRTKDTDIVMMRIQTEYEQAVKNVSGLHLITMADALNMYQISRATIQRHIADRSLTTYRGTLSPSTGAHLFEGDELKSFTK